MVNSSIQDAGDGHLVCYHQTDKVKGDDRIECDVRTGTEEVSKSLDLMPFA